MKTNPSTQRSGVALVIVLVFVVLLSVFILSFFTNAQNELSASQSFSGEISAHQLAETASSLVMGQVREATTQPKIAWASQPGMIRTYGSAAGVPSEKALGFYKLYSSDDMIVGPKEFEAFRTKFGDTAFLGGEIPLGKSEDDKEGWESQPALYTDLNSPITLAEPAADGSTVVKFPIIDGHDMKAVTPPSVAANPSSEGVFKPVWTYDGVNQSGERGSDGVADVEGFAVDMKAVPRYEVPTDEKPLSPSNTPVPMPVRWMYVLRDGSLTVPPASKEDNSTKQMTIADWSGVKSRKPTRDNPVVGRIAFWADDDTCKVNINTAGGFNFKDISRSLYQRERDFAGSYWDQPRTATRFDYGDSNDDGINGEDGSVNVGGLSITQPIAREYQRYPGHPATTSLGLLFKDLLNSEQLYSILPRVRNRGTRGGTERIFSADPNKDPSAPAGETIPVDEDDFQPLALKRDRIYASVDEFLFGGRFKDGDPFRPLNNLQLMTDPTLIDSRLGGRVYNDQLKPGQTGVSPEVLERMRFFLTAHSRAPELNLFGRPRITIWPSYPDETRLNASDRLLNFCSTIGPRTRADGSALASNEMKLFQFQRSDPYSPTADWDGTTQVTPRRVRMPQTPEGGTRNQFIHRYLQEMTNDRVPGFKEAGFRQKYGEEDRDQILTSIFDYMRCVNMRDSTRDKYIYPTAPKNPPAPQWKEIERFKFAPQGVVVPIAVSEDAATTRGFGRFPIFSEAAFVLYHAGYATEKRPGWIFKSLHNPARRDGLNDWLNEKHPRTGGGPWKGKQGVTFNAVRAFLIFETFVPAMGYAPMRTLNQKSEDRFCFVVEVDGLNNFNLSGSEGAEVTRGTRLGWDFPAKAKNLFLHASGAVWHGRNLGGSEGWMHMLRGSWHWGKTNAQGPQGNTSNNPPALMVPNKWGIDPPVAGSTPPTANWYEFQSPGTLLVKYNQSEPSTEDPVTPDDAATREDNYLKYLREPARWQTVQLSGADLTVRLRFGEAVMNGQGALQDPKPPIVSTLNINFPRTTVPVPTDHIWMHDPGGFSSADFMVGTARNADWAVDELTDNNGPSVNYEGVKSFGGRLLSPPRLNNPYANMNTQDLNNSGPSGWRSGGVFGASSANETTYPNPGWNHTNRWRQLLQPGDVIRSVVLGVEGDDPRVAAINTENSAKFYSPHPDYDKPDIRHAQSLRTAEGTPQFSMDPNHSDRKVYNAGLAAPFGKLAEIPASYPGYNNNRWPDIPPGINGVRMGSPTPTKTGRPGDFDTGLGNLPDGPYIGKADEGNPVFRVRDSYRNKAGEVIQYWRYPHPYFNWDYEETFDTFFTPNRQTPSAVVFGSLPAGKNAHWTTLAFSPFSAYESSDKNGKALHPGRREGFVRDHLLLDLFNMPIVEPYAISEPFSTAGKVNMNYPMMPFTHIERSTAFRAALHSVRVSAFPSQHASIYKASVTATAGAYMQNYNYRYPVDRNLTVRAFKDIFDAFKKDVDLGMFKSASEICDRGLFPTVLTRDAVKAPRYTGSSRSTDPDNNLKTEFWLSNALTGDNMREKPYSDLYPRLTTKSNTYTVHVRAQSLRQTPQSAELGVWDEKKDRVIGEYRGSSTIERFIDPEDARFDPRSSVVKEKDKINVDKDSLEPAYRFRVISTKRFVP